VTLTRRALLTGVLLGAAATLPARPVSARKPVPKQSGVYSDTYSNTY